MVAHHIWDVGEQFESGDFDYAEDSLIGRAIEN